MRAAVSGSQLRRELARAALLALAAFASQRSAGAPPQDSPTEAEAAVSALGSSALEEFFVLELSRGEGSNASRPAAPAPVGVAVWRRASGSRSQCELEARFFEERARVHLVEESGSAGSTLVFREWRSSSGRTVRVQPGERADVLQVVEWGRAQPVRESFSTPATPWLALHDVELVRSGAATASELARSRSWFDPLGRRTIEVRGTLEWRGEPAADSPAAFELARTVRWTDESGACVGEQTFVGDELRSFRWQGGDLVARRVPREEHLRLLEAQEATAAVER